MLTGREQELLAGIDRRLQEQDPDWASRLSGGEPPRRARGSRALDVVVGLLAVAAVVALLLGATDLAGLLALATGSAALTRVLEGLG